MQVTGNVQGTITFRELNIPQYFFVSLCGFVVLCRQQCKTLKVLSRKNAPEIQGFRQQKNGLRTTLRSKFVGKHHRKSNV